MRIFDKVDETKNQGVIYSCLDKGWQYSCFFVQLENLRLSEILAKLANARPLVGSCMAQAVLGA
jgi:hypothetical protein